MEIPETVKIAGIIYKVEEVEDFAAIQGVIGRLLEDKAIISLEKSLSKERKEQVFVHEVLHGIFKEAGYEEHDEDMINRVAIVLHQVLKDNDFIGTWKPSIEPMPTIKIEDMAGIGAKEFLEQVLEQPTKWDPSPLIATDPTNWGKSISQIMSESGQARCPACGKTWRRLEDACGCPTTPDFIKNPNIESEGTK